MASSLSIRRALVAALVLVFWLAGWGGLLAQQVGYSVITQRQGSRLPVASALFSLRIGNVLTTEAGVQAVAPIRAGRVFVDERSTQTGIALANPSNQSVTATLTLRNAAGAVVGTQPLTIPARQQLPRQANQLANLPAGFVGSLTFECQGSGRLAAVTIRQGVNGSGQPTFATLPVADLDQPGSGGSFVFPHLGAGGGILSSQVILINPVARRITGRIRLFGQDGNALRLLLDGRSGSEFTFDLPADGVFQGTLTNTGAAVAGYALVEIDSGGATPAGTALFQFRDARGNLDSEAGVGAIPSTTRSRIFVDTDQTNTGVAIANTANSSTVVTLDLLDRNGLAIRSTQRTIAARGQFSEFVTQLFPGLPTGFTGLLEMRSGAAVFPITLKFTGAGPGVAGNILTTLPVADLTRPPTEATLVFPQVGFGGVLETRLIFINTDLQNVSRVQLTFTASEGTPLSVPITGTTASQFNFDFVAGGGGRLRPGNSATVAEIRPDAVDQFASEVSVQRGQTIVVRPLVVDSDGQPRDDFPLTFNSLATDVATVDGLGRVTGLRDGFATLTISSGGFVQTTTVSVVEVASGSAGFEITGIARDLSRRIYMADSNRHSLLLAQNLQAAPQRLAGVLNSPGYRDDQALNALFRNPAFLAFNQVDGALYVSDSQNHVIRVVRAGRVETYAGAGGQAGASDGSRTQARFRNPQGLALDSRGFLWVVDSGNHTIRRINLMDGTVSTVAGRAGSAGSQNGRGAAARFSAPVGIAVEVESVGSQLARQLGGDPPPPVTVVVADTGNNQMRRVMEDGTVSTVGVTATPAGLRDRAGRRLGAATPQAFDGPRGVAVDAAGNIYVSEPSSNRVRTILRNGQIAPAGPSGLFDSPQAIAIGGSGEVLVADGNRLGRQISYGGPEISTISPTQIGVGASSAMVIMGSNFAPESRVVIGDRIFENVRVVNTRRIEFTAPAGLPSGEMTVTIQNRGGLAQTSLRIAPIPLAGLGAGRVTTVAGGSTYVGDGRPATQAILRRPALTAVDSGGNLYIADAVGNRIRRVDAMSGVVTTVAGTGRLGYLGDGRLAVTAELGLPLGVAVDDAGNVFIADCANAVVRRVDSRTGIITTYAGNGEPGYSGDGGPATSASLTLPLGLAVDSDGNLFISDSEFFPGPNGNSRIRRVDAGTGVITTVAGSTPGFVGDGGPAFNARLNAPAGLAFDAAGNLYIADSENHRIRRIEAGNGRIDPGDRIQTVAGTGVAGFSGDGGQALSAQLDEPASVTVDLSGNLYISDNGNLRVRRVDPTGRITTYAGNGSQNFSGDGGPATQAGLVSPVGVSTDAGGNLFIAGFLSDRVRRVDAMTGMIRTVAGNGLSGPLGDNGPAIYAGFGVPGAIALDPSGNLLVADYLGSVIRRIDGSGIIRSVAGDGELDYAGDDGPAVAASLQLPSSMVTDAAGNIYIADQDNHRIRRVDAASGIITTVAGNGTKGFSGDGGSASQAALDTPTRLALDSFGNLFVTDCGNNRVRLIDLNSGLIRTVAGNGQIDTECFFGEAVGEDVDATTGPLGIPDGLAVDLAGNLLIADTLCNRIRSVNRNTGRIRTVVGNGCNPILEDCPPFDGLRADEVSLFFPSGIVLDGGGNLFISDLFSVVRVDGQSGQVTTIAGDVLGFAGDGGPATAAEFFYPRDMAVSDNGTLFVADSVNGRVRAIPGVAAPPAEPRALFFDDVESGAGNWLTNGTNGLAWVVTTARASSPTRSLFAADVATAGFQQLYLANPIPIPQNAIAVGLAFEHFFETEAGFDGGVVEISADGGDTWLDASPYFVEGGYNSVLSGDDSANPLAGRAAFSGSSGGGFSTVLDLRSFRGNRIQIRFILGTDGSVGGEGWYVDDILMAALVVN